MQNCSLRKLVFATLTIPFLLGASEKKQEGIPTWTRASGDYTGGNLVKPINRKHLTPETLPQTERQGFDFQYQKKEVYRGVALSKVIAWYKPTPKENLILLHFANGMIIPVPRASLKEMDPFVAFAMRNKKDWTSSFPNVAKQDETWNDPRPIQFQANKVVVAKGNHPYMAVQPSKSQPEKNVQSITGKTVPDFSPWRHVDSLVGIEFVNKDRYEAQFAAKPPLEHKEGFAVWKHRCQFCHGMDKVGASLGWDFLKPIPIYELKKPQHLYNKVKYPYHDALVRGLLMPQQTDVEKGEMYGVWGYLKALNRKGVQPYKRP